LLDPGLRNVHVLVASDSPVYERVQDGILKDLPPRTEELDSNSLAGGDALLY
jgi:hypothetical protein